MTLTVETAALVVCGLLAAETAFGGPGPPDPANSTYVAVVNVVGRNADGVDSYGTFTCTVRDFANAPIANADVVFDFTNCTDGALCLDAVPGPDCSGTNKVVHGTTNLDGRVTFTIQGGRKAAAPTCVGSTCSAPGPSAGCIQIFMNGIPQGNASAVYVNQMFVDGSPVNGGDLSVESAEVLCSLAGGPYRARHDLQFNGAINGGDLSVLAAQVIRALAGTGTSLGCASICPN